MIRSRVIPIIIVLLLIVIGSAHLRATQASCITIPGTSIICNNDDDTVNVAATTLTQTLDGGGGNDTLIVVDSLSRVGNNSTDSNHGIVGGLGQDSIINYGQVRGFIGIRDGEGTTTLPDTNEDFIGNYGTIFSQDTGIMGGRDDILVNYNLIQANVGISCFFASGSGCDLTNFGVINDITTGLQGSSLNDGALNSSLVNSVVLYSGNDTMTNLGPGRIGYIQTGPGNDVVVNNGSIEGLSGVDLGPDDDNMLNQGSTLRNAWITHGVLGGAGNDTIINGTRAYVGGIDGGSGNDSIINSSTVAGAITGGSGNDTITVMPGGRANYLGGDDGADSVSNRGFVNTTLQGGINNDTVTNFAGATASWLDGFTGDDFVFNGGFLNADLIGGDGNDSVVNLAGAYAAFAYGDAGNDTVINGGWLNGSAFGGTENDIVVNLGGANATNLYGDAGNDSVFNGGYLIGTLFGGIGNDTLVNAAFAFAQGADLGDGDDQFTNGGWLNSALQCGAGNDTISVGGRIEGGIVCGDGNDLVYILNGVVAGQGAAVIGTINGGNGSDGLGFAFTVNVPSLAAANAISAAIAAASPAGGTITIGSMTYTWANFEALYNLLSFNILEDVVITIPVTRRVNQHDAAAPVAIYCAAGGVELWTVGADGAGSFAASIPYADVNAGTSLTVSGVTFTSSAGGTFTVTATSHDGKPYAFTGACS